MQQLEPTDPAYNVGLAVAIDGPLNPHWCRVVVDGIERRHAALRMRFGVRPAGPSGAVAPWRPVDLPMVELGPDGDQQAVLASMIRRPFDLESGPPVRWCLITAGPGQHVLALVVHHIVFDGASVGPLVADLEALASAARSGIPEPHVAEVVDRAADRTADLDAGVRYWRANLKDPPPPVILWPAPRAGDGAVPCARLALEPATRALLVDTGRRHRTSHLTPIAAALIAIIHRYTAATDVILGMPTHGGSTAGIGHRINVVPVRVSLPRRCTYAELVDGAREAVLGALEHCHVPFEDIVDAVEGARSAGTTPLFQVLLVAQQPQSPPQLDGLVTRLLDVPPPAAKYALEVTVIDGGERTELVFQADPGLCSPVTLTEFVGRFEAILKEAVADPGARVGQLSMQPRRRVPAFPVRGRSARSSSRTTGGDGVHKTVQTAVVRYADRIAVHAADGQLSYAELDRQAARLAGDLQRLGAGPERTVAVCLDRGLVLPVALLAVARTGAAFLPLDPGLPDERLRLVLDASRALVFVGSRERAERCGFSGPTVDPDLVPGNARPAVNRPAVPSGHPELAAYVLATSGSTGRPKLVVMRRAGFAALMRWARETFDDAELSAVAAMTSIGFDLSIFELFAPLSTGGTVFLLDAPGDLSGPVQRRATLLNTVPSVLETVLDLRLLPMSTLAVNVAGEPLHQDLVDRVLAHRPAAAVRNLYGPTEATTYVTGTPPLTSDCGSPSIGRAVAGARLQVTDDDAQQVLAGLPGELRVGGRPLARGYLHAPGSTARAFVPDADGDRGARAYRTGDIVRARESGELEFLGRRDHQVKVRGVRIELEEIQAVLRGHPTVVQAVVIVRGESRDRRLVGCVEVGDRHQDVDIGSLTSWLRVRLPEVMTPREWVILARLPMTANGKVDRRTLASLPATESQVGRTSPPRTAMECAVARCWHDVLGRCDVGVDDVFFDAGGNSLSLMLLHAALQERFDPDIRLADLFRRPSIATQAAMVEARADTEPPTTTSAPQAGPAGGAVRGSARRQVLARRSRER